MSAVKTKVMIADPDPDLSRTLRLYFMRHGFEVEIVDTAERVVTRAQQGQPNAILVSTEFSDADPYQVCRQLVEDSLTSHIPTLMLLHLNDRQSRLAALEAGVDNVMGRPIDLEELRLRMEAAIRLATLRVQP